MVGVSGQALNEAITGLAEGGSEVGKSITSQTKNIVNKKFGEDYVKTFIEGEEKLEEKEEKTEDKTENAEKV